MRKVPPVSRVCRYVYGALGAVSVQSGVISVQFTFFRPHRVLYGLHSMSRIFNGDEILTYKIPHSTMQRPMACHRTGAHTTMYCVAQLSPQRSTRQTERGIRGPRRRNTSEMRDLGRRVPANVLKDRLGWVPIGLRRNTVICARWRTWRLRRPAFRRALPPGMSVRTVPPVSRVCRYVYGAVLGHTVLWESLPLPGHPPRPGNPLG